MKSSIMLRPLLALFVASVVAVVLGTGPEGDAVMERAPAGVGSSFGAGIGGSMVGADMTNLRFEVITGEPSEGASGSSSRGIAP